jgi:hypothetical protein
MSAAKTTLPRRAEMRVDTSATMVRECKARKSEKKRAKNERIADTR